MFYDGNTTTQCLLVCLINCKFTAAVHIHYSIPYYDDDSPHNPIPPCPLHTHWHKYKSQDSATGPQAILHTSAVVTLLPALLCTVWYYVFRIKITWSIGVLVHGWSLGQVGLEESSVMQCRLGLAWWSTNGALKKKAWYCTQYCSVQYSSVRIVTRHLLFATQSGPVTLP